MIRIGLFLSFISLAISTTALAGWTELQTDVARKIKVQDPNYISTARANCYARGVKEMNIEHTLDRQEFKSFYTKKPVEFDLLYPQNFKQDQYQIVHVFPGIFGNTDDGIMYIFIEQILKAGNIVSVYPNPLSRQYFKSIPKKISAGNLEEEADFFKFLVLESEKRIQAKFPASKKIKSRFLGLSYGAFVATIVNAKLSQLKPNFSSELVLFSPPFEMKSALAYIDKSLLKMEKDYSHFPIVYDAVNMWKVCYSKVQDFNKFLPTAKKMVLHLGFLENLSKSLVSYMKNRGEWNFMWYPFRLMTNNYFEWKKSLRFGKVINDFKLTRTKLFLGSEKSRIDYWISEIRKTSKTDIKIYAAKDDFLNHQRSWDDAKIPAKSLILTEKGGHLGFLDRSDFIDLLNQIYLRN